jgi:cardiolipin synthase
MQPSAFQFYTDAESAWQAIEDELSQAKVSIDIEHYIFIADQVGKKFLYILQAKQKEGVKVRLLLDAVGSSELYYSEIHEELRKAGVEIKFFNPIRPWRIHTFTSWFFRDHRKIIVVDGRTAFTGGLGINARMSSWRDTTARIEGDMVEEIRSAFEEMWLRSGMRGIVSKIKRGKKEIRYKSFLTNAPYFKRRFLYHTLIKRIVRAKRYIWLTTPYLVPDRRLLDALWLAHIKGVEIKIMIPKVSDVLLVNTAAHSTFDEILKSARIFEYHGAFLHAKTAVIDDAWATMGSFNLDSLSFRYNFEANAVWENSDAVLELKKHFEKDMEECREVHLPEWRRRPFVDKVREFFITPIRGFF